MTFLVAVLAVAQVVSLGVGSDSSAPGAPFTSGRAVGPGFGEERLVVGAPGEKFSSVLEAGGVHCLLQGDAALSTEGAKWFDQYILGYTAGLSDEFGYSVASGDFNGDRRPDLAVGVPGEDVMGMSEAGEVDVVYGGAGGLSPSISQVLNQATLGLSPEFQDHFGKTLAVGDFDGDGYDDLAVGAESEDVGAKTDAGGFSVLYGGSSGLSAGGSQWFDQGTLGLSVEIYDLFGAAIVAGDFNGDGYDDLTVSAPEENFEVPFSFNAGGFSVLYGGPGGLSTSGSQWFDQATLGLSIEQGDLFGSSLASGDLNGDGYDDLVVGAPGEDIADVAGAGGMSVLYGGPGGLSASGSQWLDQDTLELSMEEGDAFGSSLASGDLDRDGYDDVAVGVPLEDVGFPFQVAGAGEVNILYGSSAGLSLARRQVYDQGLLGLGVEAGDRFGEVVVIGDMNRDGYGDLAVGVPYEDVGGAIDAGGVHVLYGRSGGLSTLDSQWIDQNLAGLSDASEMGDRVGFSLAIMESAVLFSDGFESGDTLLWSATTGG